MLEGVPKTKTGNWSYNSQSPTHSQEASFCRMKPNNPEPALLFVAGKVLQLQHLTATDIDDYVTTAYIPMCITEKSNEFTLQNACQKAIRKHLLDNDFRAHLFNRKDKLGWLVPLRSYLLFNIHPEIEEACKSSK